MKPLKQALFFNWALFIFLWAYIVIRTFSVFYVHDEIVTKWAYMVDWNPFPLQGYFDANNHFLNSLLGGFFIRLFQSDTMWVVRLSSVLSFPLYYWSIVAFKRFFKQQASFYFFLISLTAAPFLLEYFSLARGYAASWAFLVAGCYFAASYLDAPKIKHLLFSLLTLILAIYANLALIPSIVILVALLAFKVFSMKERRSDALFLLVLFAAYIIYFVKYAFMLQSAGKLYLGAASEFLNTTVAPFARYLWHLEGFWAKAIPLLLAAFLFFTFLFKGLKREQLLKANWLFSHLLFLSFIGIFILNWLLGTNFPEDRGAAHLLLFFFGGLAFIFDRWENQKIIYPFIGLSALFFFTKANFSHTQTYFYEHFDDELFLKIPDKVHGIPPATGGRFWNIDNELSRIGKFPPRVFQNSSSAADTLQDYIITLKEFYPNFKNSYNILHQDPISGLCLLERETFMKRYKSATKTSEFDGTFEYINLMGKKDLKKGFIHCFGKIENIEDNKELIFILSQHDSSEIYQYVGFSPYSGIPLNADGSIEFDLTFTALDFGESTITSFYMWNRKQVPLKGKIETEFYKLKE